MELQRRRPRGWQTWVLAAAIPAVGLLELAVHFVQTCSIVGERDWKAARDYVASQVKPEDLIVFVPRWADPLGREYFGSNLATIEREARGDEQRFRRAFEVSIRGAHQASIANWRITGKRTFGRVLVTTLDNPAPVRVLSDLVSMVSGRQVRVARVQGAKETECGWTHAAAESGGLGYGPAVPADRFVCPGGGFVAPTVLTELNYYPGRRCIYAPLPGAGAMIRLRFPAVNFGHTLHGHHGLYVEAEQPAQGPPVTIAFRTADATAPVVLEAGTTSVAVTAPGSVLGVAVHNDGDGWKSFDFDTERLAGTRGDLLVEIGASRSDRRMYCFEAITW